MVLLLLLPLLFILLWPADVATSTLSMAKPNCKEKCGNITVPYPFGFGHNKECYRDESFRLICKRTYHKRKLFHGELEVLSISLLDGQQRVLAPVIGGCSNESDRDNFLVSFSNETYTKSNTFTFSEEENKFIAMGCDTNAFLTGSDPWETHGCFTNCDNAASKVNYSCPGIGCCQTSIPVSFGRKASITVYTIPIDQNDSRPCGYAFLLDKAEERPNRSGLDILNVKSLAEARHSRVPVVVDWAVEGNYCPEAMKNSTTYACCNNSDCGVAKNGRGYLCKCSKGYEGNPYLPNGCRDIDECVNSTKNNCLFGCTNLLGTYECSCPAGHHGDGKKNGTGCSKSQFPMILGPTLGFLFLIISSVLVFYALLRRKENKLKKKFFKQNGGFMLKQQLSSHEASVEGAKIFTAEELKHATNNYAQSQILGRGGYGVVYKGFLPNHVTVAIKKSKLVDESQIEQFINEVVILSQINHRNVVKLLGCCLETEVPILVYEFVSNKTLFHHIHSDGCNSLISWDNRLRIAVETSEALAYLHSAALPPIIHRDIKSANILLDNNYMAKVADFGASRLVPIDQTQISTLVQGTLGYLDPEYLQSCQLTEKSDVYSFGVVLVELLTGKKALYSNGLGKDLNLAMQFITSIKEGRTWDLLVDRIRTEGCKEQIQEVLKLAERCLRVKGEERPTMKEVAMELQGLRNYQRHSWVVQNAEQVESQFVIPSDSYSHNTIGYDSLTNEALMSLDGG